MAQIDQVLRKVKKSQLDKIKADHPDPPFVLIIEENGDGSYTVTVLRKGRGGD